MTRRNLLPLAAAGALILALALVWFMVYHPARTRLGQRIANARTVAIPRLELEAAELVGTPYRRHLERVKVLHVETERRLVEQARQQTQRLRRWFETLGSLGPEDLPHRDTFAQALKFQQDELQRQIHERLAGVEGGRALGEAVGTVPLHVPVFVREDRLPTNKELPVVQRVFNLQRQLLLQAAAEGAVPYEPPEIDLGWRPEGDATGRFLEHEAVLHLLVASRRVPRLLRALLELDGQGPVVRLTGVATRPRELPDRIEPGRTPPVEADVHLQVVVMRPGSGGL